jgi:hypothetical protein
LACEEIQHKQGDSVMKLLLALSFALGFGAVLIGIENNQAGPIWLGVMFIMFGVATSAFAIIENAMSTD